MLVQKVWSEPVNINGANVSLEDFYKQFHAYVRSKLRIFYGPVSERLTAYIIDRKSLSFTSAVQDANIKKNGFIPAHLLGNMWAQHWDNIEPIVRPFDDTTILDVTQEMVKQVILQKYVEQTRQ